MAATVPDDGTASFAEQATLYQRWIDAQVAAAAGTEVVLSGFGVSSVTTLTIALAKGAALAAGVLRAVAAGNAVIGAGSGAGPRVDSVVINSAGAITVRAGTASAAPKPAAATAGDVLLYLVWVPTSASSITAANVTDARHVRTIGDITIAKSTTAVTFNTTTAIQTYASVTLPSGLFLAGKVLRCRCGGDMLINSGTPTVTLTISYGGTTMFADVSGTFTASAVRKAWFIDFDLVAVANNSQVLSGLAMLPAVAAITAPTTGTGDAWSNAQAANPIMGTAAVDSDAGDRDLLVRFTMNVSNVADEISCKYSTFELVA